MSDKIRILSLGGLDEDGKNCTLVQINDDIFVVGCGVKFPNKTMPGIDYVIPDFTYLKQHKDDVKGYFLLHGHDDEIGALAYIYEEVPAPVYGSNVTLKMLQTFTKHVDKDPDMYDLRVKRPSDVFKVAGREVRFFQTAHNIANSSGISINTTEGNIVFSGDFVVENGVSANYLSDFQAVAEAGESANTLVLLTESVYAEHKGYTAPNYKLLPLIGQKMKDAPGRVIVSIFAQNFYNIDELIKYAVANHKVIVPYDDETSSTLKNMQISEQLVIPVRNYANLDALKSTPEKDIIILMLGYGIKLFNKIEDLAEGSNSNKLVAVKKSDTFIVASPSNNNTEIDATDAINALYHTGCDIINIHNRELLKMHASEEDIKMVVSYLRPKYYIPVKGTYKDLLANCMIILDMNVGLTHQHISLLENGVPWTYENGKAIVKNKEALELHDTLIDGVGSSDIGSDVLKNRRQLAEGVVLVTATVSKSKRKIVAGPDVQVRGVVYMRDVERLIHSASRTFVSTITQELQKDNCDFDTIQKTIRDRVSRSVRYETGKEPFIVPIIIIVD